MRLPLTKCNMNIQTVFLTLCTFAATLTVAQTSYPGDDSDSLTLDVMGHIVADFLINFEVEAADTPLSEDDDRNLSLAQRARERMLSSRIEGLRIDRAVLRSEGSVAGVGLFATRDIAEGELITCYPGDALVYQPTDGIIFGGHVLDDDPDLVSGWADSYGLALDDDYALVGIPYLDADAAYLGHYCNDGARLVGGEEGVDAYVEASGQASNAEHVEIDGLHMVTVASRAIRRGAEVLVTYGEDYWIEFLEREERALAPEHGEELLAPEHREEL